ncbi:MAG TPA: universal stress protein [Gemmatimonadaceae bacterium]|nr:universal stress protein [Gemmatimonadaceae bacterium]
MAPLSSPQTASRAAGSEPRATQLSPVFPAVVAVTADAAASGAIYITHALAQECGAIPTVLRVVQDDIAVGAAATGTMVGVPEAALDPAYRTSQLAVLENQVQRILGTLPSWQYDVEIGVTVPTIVRRAHDLRAEIVILGLPDHNFFRRAFVRDTVQGIVEHTQAAVFAVRPELVHRPESILVALDFGIGSLRAAHLACQLVVPGGRVILVYVQPDLPPASRADATADATNYGADDASALLTAITLLIDELTSQKAVSITSIIEHGGSIEGVKQAAVRMRPDVIALGARHHSAVDWFFGDSVSADLLNDRRWSLLMVPE